MNKMIFVAIALGLAGCTKPDEARRTLDNAGYSDIHIGGYAAFKCDSKSDTYATEFTAKGPTGHQVTGAVCSGLLKGNTIRTD